ncbi:Hypothetical_protein [Hexamita inflata]|uniref:Hypothetical_protein n=1 Tax=Hexamita inflata TaxID=28002 RepID=A0ABP1GE50_9EUKA
MITRLNNVLGPIPQNLREPLEVSIQHLDDEFLRDQQALKTQLRQAQSQLLVFQNDIQILRAKLNAANTEISVTSSENAALKKTNYTQDLRLQQLQTKTDQHNQVFYQLSEQSRSKIADVEREHAQTKLQLSEMNNKLTLNQNECERIVQQHQSVLKSITIQQQTREQEFNAQIQYFQSSLSSEHSTLTTQLQNLRQENTELQQQLQEALNNVAVLKLSNEEIKIQLRNQMINHHEAENQMKEEFQNAINQQFSKDSKSKNSDLLKTFSLEVQHKFQKQLEGIENENSDLKHQLFKANETLAEKDKLVEELSGNRFQQDFQLKKLTEKVAEMTELYKTDEQAQKIHTLTQIIINQKAQIQQLLMRKVSHSQNDQTSPKNELTDHTLVQSQVSNRKPATQQVLNRKDQKIYLKSVQEMINAKNKIQKMIDGGEEPEEVIGELVEKNLQLENQLNNLKFKQISETKWKLK